MKDYLKIAGVILCASLMITGCSEGRDRNDDGTGGGEQPRTVAGSESEAETTQTTLQAPDAPTNLRYVYQKDQKALKFTWNSSKGAARYEVKNGTITTIAIKNETVLDNVEEGDSGTLFVRAVDPTGQVSEWSDIDFSVEVHIDPPGKTYIATDGGMTYIYWDHVDGATAYEVNYYGADGMTYPLKITYPYRSFSAKIDEGKTGRFDIRSVKTVRSQNYYSDWQTFNYTDPTFKALKDYSFYESCTLDYARLKDWAKVNNYSFTSTKDGDDTIVEITFKDDVNSKLWAKIKRVAGDMFNAAMEGYDEGLFDLENNVEAFRESKKKLKLDFFDRLNEKAEKDAENSAIVAGIKSVFTQIKVRCQYRFTNQNTAPVEAAVALDKRNRANYAKDFASQHKPDSSGLYKFYVEGSGQNYFMEIDQSDKYWEVYLYPEHVK